MVTTKPEEKKLKEMGSTLLQANTRNTYLTVAEVGLQVKLIQELMRGVMRDGEHFGKVPGCDKPSLFKPGAEKVNFVFKLVPEYEEVSTPLETDDHIFYKIRCILKSSITGQIMGTGLGSCNSKEKKYKTRSVYPNKATEEEKAIGKPEKRTKWNKEKRAYITYDVLIVPQDPWDIANTIYKMACKRALIAATLNATAASDIFTQDIEDFEHLQNMEIVDGEYEDSPVKPQVDMPQSRSGNGNNKPTEKPQEQKPEPPQKETSPAAEENKTTAPGEMKESLLEVHQATQRKPGEKVNITGIFMRMEARPITTKKGKKTFVFDYTIHDFEDATAIVVSSWKEYELKEKDEVICANVDVLDIRGTQKFAAESIQVQKPEITWPD